MFITRKPILVNMTEDASEYLDELESSIRVPSEIVKNEYESRLDEYDIEFPINELFLKAEEVHNNAYAPYSDYNVSSAILAQSGNIYTGVNVENCAYTTGTHAEQNAYQNAITAEKDSKLLALVLITEDKSGTPPCLECRQCLAESVSDTFPIFSRTSKTGFESYLFGQIAPFPFRPTEVE